MTKATLLQSLAQVGERGLPIPAPGRVHEVVRAPWSP